MKKVGLVVVSTVMAFVFNACSKDCHECHYENASNMEVELGEKCDDELEQLEADGIVVDGVTYEVHCHEH